MKGFFHQETGTAGPKGKDGGKSKRGPVKSAAHSLSGNKPVGFPGSEDGCELCGLYESVNTPKLGITGEGRSRILCLGEAQGRNEDEKGRQFVGDAGEVLRKNMKAVGLNFEKDFYALNCVRCFTYKEGKQGRISRNPTDQEIKYCWKGTWELIRELKPKAIWTFGLVPLQSYLLGKGQDKPAIAKWRGWAIPDQDLQCWIIPHYHPSFVLRNSYNRGLENLFKNDLRDAISKSENPFFVNNAKDCIHLLSHYDAEMLLRRLLMEKCEFAEIDYETTGIKPYKEGHDIFYAAISPDHQNSYAFDLRNPVTRELFVQFLNDPYIYLAAHNAQMEQLWSRVILKANIPHERWAWDSMIAAHVCDNRSKITSLEFQAAVRYGDWYFKDATDSYLKCPTTIIENGEKRNTGGNDFNRIAECPEKDIMTRVALDALYGRWLSFDQMAELEYLGQPMKRGKKTIDAYWLFHDGTLALGDTSIDGGLLFDERYFAEKKQTLEEEVRRLKEEIIKSEPARVYYTTIAPGKELNPGSDDQISKILFGHYGITPLSFTEKAERGQVNYDLLSSLSDHVELGLFCTAILQYNKLDKLRSTYIDGFARESWNGVIHPHLGLNIPRTYRSSSSLPNFQNIPNRDDYSRNIIRMGLFPWPGHRGLGADFGSHEFVCAANYSRDPVMIKYIIEGGDPHGDQARRIFLLTTKQMTKKIRHIGKNGWVFPEQYGQPAAYRDKTGNWMGCAPNMWNMASIEKLPDGTPLLDHIISKGIKTLDQFAQHCQAEEAIYWKKFAKLKEWQNEWIARYEREGVVPMYHGFRATGLMSKNEVLNYSIQGTGFHFLLESLIELNMIRKKEEWQSKIIGQIHDEIVFSVQPNEFDYITQLITWVMRDLMQERHNDFLVCPLKVEFKAGEIDQPWATWKGM
jgi:uracil-DNA glycosylase family 4